jgi:hypothetical protein
MLMAVQQLQAASNRSHHQTSSKRTTFLNNLTLKMRKNKKIFLLNLMYNKLRRRSKYLRASKQEIEKKLLMRMDS